MRDIQAEIRAAEIASTIQEHEHFGKNRCKHAYQAHPTLYPEPERWCKLNLNKDCDHKEDPENCEYNIKGIVREEY